MSRNTGPVDGRHGAAPRPRGRFPSLTCGIAVLPVFGILGQRMKLPLQMSGGTSPGLLSRDVQQLLADDDVASIVLLVDSPGGLVPRYGRARDEALRRASHRARHRV